MEQPASDNYLLTALRTAPPQKIHLMLIEGAIRFCHRATEQRQAGQLDEALGSLLRAQEIAAQLLADLDAQSPLAIRLADVYQFVYVTLSKAFGQLDGKLVDDAVRVLEVERETWRQVCERLPDATPPRRVPPPHMASPSASEARSGFSVEA